MGIVIVEVVINECDVVVVVIGQLGYCFLSCFDVVNFDVGDVVGVGIFCVLYSGCIVNYGGQFWQVGECVYGNNVVDYFVGEQLQV